MQYRRGTQKRLNKNHNNSIKNNGPGFARVLGLFIVLLLPISIAPDATDSPSCACLDPHSDHVLGHTAPEAQPDIKALGKRCLIGRVNA